MRAEGGGPLLLSGETRAALLEAATEAWPRAAEALEGRAAEQAEAMLSAFWAHHVHHRKTSEKIS